MPNVEIGELVVLGILSATFVGYFVGVIALIAWGRRIAKRLGGRWRFAPWLPALGLLVQLGGTCSTVGSLVMVFRGMATSDAALRATVLAQGISEAMKATACAVPISLLVYGASIVLFAVVGRRPPSIRD
ncbi:MULTISPECIES: MotA/TolQ/ExbB proton channel family protein [Sandaracinus]|uniref:MotA/TolQ/ExbB proton channel family protein n=1 Tax=Sandaracinus TaxID=1055688 RepID=UPI0019D483F7|nr:MULTISPECIES: hypothetical protein [Sandaracinus]UJR87269.1 Hypothetical protein I5071_610 [Sandaracinus amylolyticus]